VLHRENIDELPQLLELATSLEPYRIELANAQYLGWALLNRDRLLPSVEQLEYARRLATAAAKRLSGKTDVLFVLPDYYAGRPRACMQGWGQGYLVVTPDGLVLPCQAARDLPGLLFEDVRSAPLGEIWSNSAAFRKFRGTDWQPEPCRSCPELEKDLGGCRCQAFALTGDVNVTDPACSLTPAHHLVLSARRRATEAVMGAMNPAPLQLRRAPQRALVD
jgi:PqqA peptide cyclase